jgi:hypothetical protein
VVVVVVVERVYFWIAGLWLTDLGFRANATVGIDPDVPAAVRK